ncbi:hypothetical protein [Glutamicibacter sp.]|uniref:hypothetical protein n=1 Tax=Glutamicibacter sp. TaxID=1931995 RepID=UPI002B4A76E6|nr:hypothetical protein [Glutamicibacter sp.]HJX79172.1 hypothetical protein [Glutamicibacter sp.]
MNKMYCSKRNCYREMCPDPDNYQGFCVEHLTEQRKISASQDAEFQEKLKKNLESLKEVEERIKARKEHNEKV